MSEHTSRILHRRIHGSVPTAVEGRGIEIFDSNGKAYIDASGGAAVSCLGHGHPAINEAIKAQLDKLAYAHSSFFSGWRTISSSMRRRACRMPISFPAVPRPWKRR